MMIRRLVGMVVISVVYFGLILLAAGLVAAGLISAIPAWSLPVFAVLAVFAGMIVGTVRLLDVLITFILIVAVFPIGLLYLIGVSGNLTTTQTLTIIAVDAGVWGWVLMLSPVGAAVVGYLVLRCWRRETT